MKNPHCTKTWKHFSKILYDNPGLTIQGQVSFLALPGGGTDDGNMISIQERQRSSLPPCFSFDHKAVAHQVLRCGISHPPSCKPQVCVLSHFSHVQLCAALWTVACQAPLSMGFSRQEYCSGLPCPPPRDLPNPGIKPAVSPPSSALQVYFCLPLSHPGSPR